MKAICDQTINLASSVIVALSTLDTGQFFSASPARRANAASSRFGTLPRKVSAELTDAKALAFRVQRDRGLGGELRRRKAGALQPECQRHREAAGMGGGDQFFGIGPFSFSKRVLNE